MKKSLDAGEHLQVLLSAWVALIWHRTHDQHYFGCLQQPRALAAAGSSSPPRVSA